MFTELYIRLTGDQLTLAEHVEKGKRMVVTELLPAEVRRIAALAPEVADAGAALAEVAVAFAVYRSYLPDGRRPISTRRSQLAERRRPGAGWTRCVPWRPGCTTRTTSWPAGCSS